MDVFKDILVNLEVLKIFRSFWMHFDHFRGFRDILVISIILKGISTKLEVSCVFWSL